MELQIDDIDMSEALSIFCAPEELSQGLFGETFYYLLQILPYLNELRAFPHWELRTLHYGDPPDRLTIPGVLELAYEPPPGPYTGSPFRRCAAGMPMSSAMTGRL